MKLSEEQSPQQGSAFPDLAIQSTLVDYAELFRRLPRTAHVDAFVSEGTDDLTGVSIR